MAAKYLQHLTKAPEAKPEEDSDGWPAVEILGRAKDEAQNKGFFQQVAKEIQSLVSRLHQA
jgi:hypothetical protein